METKIIQITSGKGPQECERVVWLVIEKMKKEWKKEGLEFELIHEVPGKQDHTLFSAMVKLTGHNTAEFCKQWVGTIQWIAQSPYRKFHKRKNWFVGVIAHAVPEKTTFSEHDISFQTMRASGSGGQNVNKVESAVRATHVPSGLSVTVTTERSQLMNKKEAVERLKNKLLCAALERQSQDEHSQWMEHNLLARGNPVRTFREPMD